MKKDPEEQRIEIEKLEVLRYYAVDIIDEDTFNESNRKIDNGESIVDFLLNSQGGDMGDEVLCYLFILWLFLVAIVWVSV